MRRWGLLTSLGVTGWPRSIVAILGLAAYAALVTSGPSVWRATLTAMAYLAARLVDHRSPPWNALAISAAVLAILAPLRIRDAAFALTFGTTVALIQLARHVWWRRLMAGPLGWALATILASFAVELRLLPVSAVAFSRVTVAGLVLNLAALPLMTVAQTAAMVLVLCPNIDVVAGPSAWLADVSIGMLVGSAKLVDAVPWLAPRVPPPAMAIVLMYYAALAGSALGHGWRRHVATGLLCVLGALIVTGRSRRVEPAHAPGQLRLTVFDVGQGDAMLLTMPDGTSAMVDAGGIGFGGSAFDIGSRVLAPALWARGVRRLDALALTHGDPDHIGGAMAMIRDFSPRQIWEGVPVSNHLASQEIANAARAAGTPLLERHAGDDHVSGGVRWRILNPPAPDWERVRVRNDDSTVIEVTFGDVVMLLTGDVSAEVERAIAPQITPGRIRILKVAHHGSRTSTAAELLATWRPDIAIVSCGRANAFGHPNADVLERLRQVRATVLKTDRDGQITLDTDGTRVSYRTFVDARGAAFRISPGG